MTYRGMALLIISMNLDEELTPPFRLSVKMAIDVLARRLRAENQKKGT